MVYLEMMVDLEPLGKMEHQGPLGHLECQGVMEQMEDQVWMEGLDSLDSREMQGHLDNQDHKGHKELRDQEVSQEDEVKKEHPEHLVMMVPQGLPVLLDHLESLELQAKMAEMGDLEARVNLEVLALWVKLDHQVDRVLMGRLDYQERRVTRVKMVLMADQGKMVVLV